MPRGILGDDSPAHEIISCVRAVALVELMTLISSGLRNKEIAWQMNITEGTVKVYLSRLFGKVGVSDRFELAILALRGAVGAPTGKPSGRTVFIASPHPAMVTFAAI